MSSNLNYKSLGRVLFPIVKAVRINMMPFVMGDMETLPSNVRQYSDIIKACSLPESEVGKIGYLTIDESFVSAGSTQRRPGIHTERHPSKSWGGGGWGGFKGGLYMCSSIGNSTRIWDERIEEPGELGDCEHLRSKLGSGSMLQAGELVWLTDATPHEAVKTNFSAIRQFFRLVTSEVSVWYEKDSTANPFGIKPGCKIVKGSKFG